MTRPAPPADLRPIDRLLAIMARLRNPDDGCPWDLEQMGWMAPAHGI